MGRNKGSVSGIGDPPDIKAAVGAADDGKDDYKEFAKAAKAMDDLLTEIESGKYAKSADLEAISVDIAAIKADMTDGFEKHQEDIASRIAEAVASGKTEVTAELRNTIADMLKGHGNATDQTQATEQKWTEVKANTQEEGRPASRFPVKGVDTYVLYADVRPPQRGGQVQAAFPGSFANNVGIGSGVTPIEPWIFLQEQDPFQEFANMIYPTNPAFTLPSLPKPTAATKNRAADPVPVEKAGINPNGGAQHADFWEKIMSYPIILEDDVAMIRTMVQANMYMMLAATWGEEVAATMKGGIAGMHGTNTGAAAALPSAKDFPAIAASMLKSVKSFYRMGAAWMMNEAVEALWNSQWSTAGAGVDPEAARGTLLGFPKRLNSHLDDGGNANDVSAYVGNYRMGLVEAILREIETRYYLESTPGDLTIYSCMRGKSALQNVDGIGYLITKA